MEQGRRDVMTDVLVVGGGNAALCAALAARDEGARVLVLEKAPYFYRGGNSRHTRDFRLMHRRATKYTTGPYDEEEFFQDLKNVAKGQINEDLARWIIRNSEELPAWLETQGVRWQQPLAGTLHLSRTNQFMLGGGKAMMNAYYQTAQEKGIEIWYETEVVQVIVPGKYAEGVVVRQGNRLRRIFAKAVVLASGGFEANREWLSEYWGDAAQRFVVRGTPYNDGRVLRFMLDHGAQRVGDADAFHGVAVDGRAPREDGGIVTRLDSVPFGIVVNQNGERFYDEGEDFWSKRYAIWGFNIAKQPNQVAFSIVDRKTIDKFLPSVFPPYVANSVDEICDVILREEGIEINRDGLRRTIETFNHSVRVGSFDPSRLDDCHTEGITPVKSHWALPLDSPPYYIFPLRTGITFTYLGLRIDSHGYVFHASGDKYDNLFAAGEMVAGNVLKRGYLAGFGLTQGAVIGRLAGKEAARVARGA